MSTNLPVYILLGKRRKNFDCEKETVGVDVA